MAAIPTPDLAVPYEAPRQVKTMAAVQPMAPKNGCKSRALSVRKAQLFLDCVLHVLRCLGRSECHVGRAAARHRCRVDRAERWLEKGEVTNRVDGAGNAVLLAWRLIESSKECVVVMGELEMRGLRW